MDIDQTNSNRNLNNFPTIAYATGFWLPETLGSIISSNHQIQSRHFSFSFKADRWFSKAVKLSEIKYQCFVGGTRRKCQGCRSYKMCWQCGIWHRLILLSHAESNHVLSQAVMFDQHGGFGYLNMAVKKDKKAFRL